VGVATVAAIGAGAGVAVGAGGDDDGAEKPITGESLEKAKAAALDFIGEGEVTETEAGDEESYYEVEVTLPSGEETDVQLDKGFNVVSSESDAVDDD